MADRKGNPIAVGDEVLIRARVTRLWEGEPGHLRNVQLDAGVLVHASQVERVGPPAPPPAPATETDEARLRDWLAQYRPVWSGSLDRLPVAWFQAFGGPLPEQPANGTTRHGERVVGLHEGGRVVVTSPYGAEIRAL